ncbi:MAG: hypothetical protein JSS12_03745 [Verrucomicrobia bacterium]|nr:hypothetical protein [Verrucomicrobiota bacterium]
MIKAIIAALAITTVSLSASLFPKSVEEMDAMFLSAKAKAAEELEAIYAIPKDMRTFDNTVRALDRVKATCDIPFTAISTIAMVHPDQAMRQNAEEIAFLFDEFMIDSFEHGDWEFDNLSAEEQYYLLDISGPDDPRVKKLDKKISSLAAKFYSNIAADKSTLQVTRDELLGLDEKFIDSLERNGELYILHANRPTHDTVLSKCHIESTRKNFYHIYANRAYPENLEILGKIIKKRQKLANLLGYTNYAELDIENQMAASPDRVRRFLEEKNRAALSDALTFWKDKKVQPWDSLYLADQYKMEHLQVNHDKVAEYFPFKKTLEGMLSIFGKFLDMQFTIVETHNLWHPDALLVEARDEHGVVGHIVFDLFPRPDKYTHCICLGINSSPPVAVVVANLTPTLLSHSQVITLFHEFGHAIHALTGKSTMPTRCGNNTVHDFVEVPSQFFEQFASDSEILTQLSSHYISGEPLSQDIINRLVMAKKLNDGSSGTLSAEICYSLISLELFSENRESPEVIQQRIMPWLIPDREDHSLCTFEHLIAYGAKYYSYPWSRILAEELFSYVKTHGGLQDPAMGRRYLEKIVGKGGSLSPDHLINSFLNDS